VVTVPDHDGRSIDFMHTPYYIDIVFNIMVVVNGRE